MDQSPPPPAEDSLLKWTQAIYALHGISLLVGPEGGLDDAEETAARLTGFASTLLGPRVLRTETAPIAALAALQTLAGDF